MKSIQYASLLFVLVFITSCTPQLNYFTRDLYNDYSWTTEEMKKIQFYLSQDIYLERHHGGEYSDIKDGSIKIESGSKVEKVIIKEGTPGVVVFSPKKDRYAVSFDDNPENYLLFGPNPKAKGRYVLLAKKWMKNSGIITYGNKEYRTSSRSAYAALMVDIRKARKTDYTKSTASGRTIDN
ncbi:MAG: hypothetical protein HKN67_05970 [Saprospiraceae bacterium]|nr:hypothetical protein [Bacteroidia bacterium]MBT8229784.1 hypothetical protein [Bacteroidia bacterium]NNF21467.1 hypothetical protein [Saprospiraceae bacterium]NNK90431.1 hypothetical protein [Saprospiraceae bacterium]